MLFKSSSSKEDSWFLGLSKFNKFRSNRILRKIPSNTYLLTLAIMSSVFLISLFTFWLEEVFSISLFTYFWSSLCRFEKIRWYLSALEQYKFFSNFRKVSKNVKVWEYHKYCGHFVEVTSARVVWDSVVCNLCDEVTILQKSSFLEKSIQKWKSTLPSCGFNNGW